MAKKLNRDDIDKFFDYGFDPTSRTIYLGCASYDDEGGDGNGVDFYMAEKFIKALHILDAQAPGGDKPITIIANNPGGSWYHGMAMYGAIKQCRNLVTMKMFGYAMSMGSIIPQAADERLIDPYARFMIHYGYDGYSGHSKIFSKSADEGKRVNNMMENIYIDRMLEKEAEVGEEGYLERTLSDIIARQTALEINPDKPKLKFNKDPAKHREDLRRALRELLNYDSYFTAEETVALGLADGVLDEP